MSDPQDRGLPRTTTRLQRLRVNQLQQCTPADVVQPSEGKPETKEPYQLKGVSFGGAGIFFWWELGCVMWLSEHVDVDSCLFFGASGGALAATLAACNVNSVEAFNVALRQSEENNLFERPLGLAGVWGNLVREWLDELLPENAAEICRDRVSLIVTTLPLFQLESISDFNSKEELINANMASVHIPFFLDGKPVMKFKDLYCLDGSFHDFISGGNSDALTCNGGSLLFSYHDDKCLQPNRFDSLALKRPEEILGMIQLGYEYSERLSHTERFKKALLNKPAEPSALLHDSSGEWPVVI